MKSNQQGLEVSIKSILKSSLHVQYT